MPAIESTVILGAHASHRSLLKWSLWLPVVSLWSQPAVVQVKAMTPVHVGDAEENETAETSVSENSNKMRTYTAMYVQVSEN